MRNPKKEIRRVAVAIERLSETPRSRDTARPAKQPRLPLGYRIKSALYTSPAKSERATESRRTFPIMAYVGPNGGGKSLAMVKDTLPSLARGRAVLSTVRLLDHETGQPHPSYVPFVDWDQLLEARDCDVLMDEMVGIAGARESAKLDVRVQNILVQLRRRNVVLRWSAPNWARADKIVREVTQAVTECRGFYSARRVVAQTESLVLWAPKRLFSFRTYDTLDFEEWTAGRREKVPAGVVEWFNGPGSSVFDSYDTMDAVERVQGGDEGGRCTTCGGTAPRPKACSCARDAAGRHLPQLEVSHENTAPERSSTEPAAAGPAFVLPRDFAVLEDELILPVVDSLQVTT